MKKQNVENCLVLHELLGFFVIKLGGGREIAVAVHHPEDDSVMVEASYAEVR